MSKDAIPSVLSVDIGTSGVRAAAFDTDGRVIAGSIAKAKTGFRTDFNTRPDADVLVQLVLNVLGEAASNCASLGLKPRFAAVSCFWHSLLGIGENGSPTTKLLTWADTSAEESASKLQSEAGLRETHKTTGCHIHSSYWPAKLLHIRNTDRSGFDSTSSWLSFIDYVYLKLSGRIGTSISMASGTGLFDQRNCLWDNDLAGRLGLPTTVLPAISDDSETFSLSPEFVARWRAFAETEWLPPIGDGAANNLGAGCYGPGAAALMIGTSGAMRVLYEGDVPEDIPEGLFCYRLDRKRVVLGGALSDGGSLISWLAGNIGIGIDDRKIRQRLRKATDPDGVQFLPFVFGERSTGYHSGASGSIGGLTRGSDGTDIVIAAMESVAFRFLEILERLESVSEITEIRASGGSLRKYPYWAQILADVLGREILVFDGRTDSLRGAALYALNALDGQRGLAHLPEGTSKSVLPDAERHRLYTAKREGHLRFYEQALSRRRNRGLQASE